MNSLDRNGSPLLESPLPAPEIEIPESRPVRLGRFTWLVLGLLVIGMLIGLVPRLIHRGALRRETRELAIPTVSVVSAAPGKAEIALVLPAEVRPYVESPLFARANGFLKHWYADIGERVNAGQLLAEIDIPELNQEVQSARAQLAEVEANLNLAKTTDLRWTELLKTASVSEQEAAEKKADLALKSANVDAARANLHRLEELQSFARITAPFGGIVTARSTDIGHLVTAGSDKELFRLAETRRLRVFVRVPQGSARGVEPGLVAELATPEMPERKFSAKVVRTAGEVDTSSRTLLTELEVDNPRDEILAGSYAQVSFKDAGQEALLTLPANTLIFRGEGTQVGVVGSNGCVEVRNVVIGRDFGRTL
jgi:membrane fusion protein (multidrug efflux system)